MKLALAASVLLSACAPAGGGDAATDTPPEPTSPAPVASASWTAPTSCPGNPDRPTGSNCYGIFPKSCGADRAVTFVGQPMSDRIMATVQGSALGGVRVIAPGQPPTADLRQGRLNIIVDDAGVITAVDCY